MNKQPKQRHHQNFTDKTIGQDGNMTRSYSVRELKLGTSAHNRSDETNNPHQQRPSFTDESDKDESDENEA